MIVSTRLLMDTIADVDDAGGRKATTQQQIGDRVGLTVVHVNRVLRRFREDGILTVQSRRVTIGNLPELVRIAEPFFDIFERAAPEFCAKAA